MRSAYWDCVKGIAIICVVIIHASSPALLYPALSPLWTAGMILNECVDFAVPMFLALAGYFAHCDGKEPPLRYYRSRFHRLIGPYAAWTVIYVALRHPHDLFSFDDMSLDMLTGTGIGIGYFVIVLSQFVLLTPLLARVRNERTHLYLMASTAVIGLTYCYIVRLRDQDNVFGEFPGYALPFIVWSPFYQLGFYLAAYPRRVEALARHQLLLATAAFVFLALSVAEGLWLGDDGFTDLGASQLKLTSFGFSAFIFAWLVALSRQPRLTFGPRPLARIGLNSYPIYLMHMLVLRAFNALAARGLAFHFGLLLKIPLSIVTALSICSLVIWSGKRLPVKGLRQALAL